MTTRITAMAGEITAANGAAASSVLFTSKSTGDAAKLMIERSSGALTAAYVQFSNDIDENLATSAAGLITAVAAATWKTYQRSAADVVLPIVLTNGIEYDPFVCKAFRFAAGTSGAPTTFGGAATFKVWKQSEL